MSVVALAEFFPKAIKVDFVLALDCSKTDLFLAGDIDKGQNGMAQNWFVEDWKVIGFCYVGCCCATIL